MTQLAEVHTLYETNARSIPDMLRRAADGIETEVSEGYSPTQAMVAVQVSPALRAAAHIASAGVAASCQTIGPSS